LANKYKGEVAFEAGGEEFVMRFSANAIVTLEEVFNKTVATLGQDMIKAPENLRLADIRTMFKIGLVDHYSETRPEIDEAKAKVIFGRLSPVEATQIVIKAFTSAFQLGEGGQAAPTANPPQTLPGQPSTGTGPTS
jgi:hypothetical protein